MSIMEQFKNDLCNKLAISSNNTVCGITAITNCDKKRIIFRLADKYLLVVLSHGRIIVNII